MLMVVVACGDMAAFLLCLACMAGPTWSKKKSRILSCLEDRSCLYSFWACLNAGRMFVNQPLS